MATTIASMTGSKVEEWVSKQRYQDRHLIGYADTPKLERGAQVLSKRGNGWEPCVVIRVNKNRTVRLEFLDGERVTRGRVRLQAAGELEAA